MTADPPSAAEIFDICVVGAGPVGLAVALAATEGGLSVLLLEAGSEGRGAQDPGGPVKIVAPRRHATLGMAVAAGMGGTSKLWGGRCVPFDDIDFERRDYVPHSGWPIGHRDVAGWYPEAARFLGCGSAEFDLPQPEWERDLGGDVGIRGMERWTPVTNTAVVNRGRISAAKRLTVRTGHRLTGLVLRDDRVVSAEALSGGARRVFRARSFVLACGGLETTRLLLMQQRRYPSAFSGADGPLGRFYMGHMSGKIADLVLRRPADIAELDFRREPVGPYMRRRFSISAAAQRRERLRNIVFWPDNPPFYDAVHHNPLLSAVFLVLAMPALGRLLLPEAVRLSHVGPPPYDIPAHLRNVLVNPHRALACSLRLLQRRYLARPCCPGFLDWNPAGRYALHYHAEQVPCAESRVSLSGPADESPAPTLLVDLRFSRADADSVVRAHEILDRALRTGGRGHLEFRQPALDRASAALAQASDGFHQIGTVRMAASARDGVVDPDLRVHGLRNLFVASSAVFPTGGQANPTFLAVALATRLAHHLLALQLARVEAA
jgi:choline dehydrogenase-like flavoprotein